jgi:hypothetical protein
MGLWSLSQLKPACLFPPGDLVTFGTAYVAGFGSSTYMKTCWTDKTGPNPYRRRFYETVSAVIYG